MVAEVDSTIQLTFDKPLDPSSFVANRSFWAFGRWSGAAVGSYVFSEDGKSVILVPDGLFSAGETVMVVIANSVRALDGTTLRASGYSYQFRVRAGQADMTFRTTEIHTTRSSPEVPSKAYGGMATDFDNDGYTDLAVVNEISNDLRVFMNNGPAPGVLSSFMEPTTPLGDHASPNEPSDFNGDGIADVTVANIWSGTISVLLGNGDGTFQPGQEVFTGSNPRGVAVLDVDGDGDMDIANTNSLSSSISVLYNDGNGVFSQPTYFDTGYFGVWGISAADMNNDGVLDLAIGVRNEHKLLIYLGRGNGVLNFNSLQELGAQVWMLAGGDINGDGNEDISIANGQSDSASILFGDGTGRIGPPTVYPVDPWATATDLGDLDGDGDLDWVVSSYLGNWTILENQGAGAFSVSEVITSNQSSSCAILVDYDNDRDLDLALIDEDADEVRLVENRQAGTIPCEDVRAFLYRCQDGFLDIALVMANFDHNGKQVRFMVDGHLFDVTVVSFLAHLRLDAPAMDVTVTLANPAGCAADLQVTCP